MITLDRFLERALWFFLFVFVVFMPFKIAVTQSSLGLALLCWALRVWLTKGIKAPRLGLEWAFVLFIAANLVSLPFSSNVPESLIFLKRLLLLPIVYVAASDLGNQKLFRALVYAFMASITWYSVLGIASFMQDPLSRVSNVHNSMTAGGITMIAALITFAALIKEKKWLLRGLWALLTMINLGCLILTATRGSWVGFFAGAFIIVWMSNKKLLLALIPLIPLFYFFTPDAFSTRIKHMFDPTWGTNHKRIVMWTVGTEILKDHPVVGIGDVSMNEHFRHNAPPATLTKIGAIGHFHSNYVHIAVSLGLVGFLTFMFMFGCVIYRLFARIKWRTGNDTSMQMWWQLAALGIFVAFAVNGLFEWNYGDAEIATMVWFSLGLALTKPMNK